MKSYLIIFLFFSTLHFGQNVILNKVTNIHTNSDKFLYKVDPELTSAEYLAEIEVQGLSDDDVKVFGLIYKKAKEIGANAFAYKPFETVDQTLQKFDPAHYKLSLYYVDSADFPTEPNVVYLISSPYKKQTISIGKTDVVFPPRTFTKRDIIPGATLTISTKKLLGSTIKLSGQENQPVQFFQLSAFSINSNPYGTAGINLKSGDITRLEQSYGQFLTTIYEQIK